jgi:hypothetical protein
MTEKKEAIERVIRSLDDLDASLSKEAVIDGPSVMAEKVYVLIRNT